MILKEWPFFKKSGFPRRNILWIIIGIAFLILIYAFGVLPLTEAKKKAEEEIALKKKAILKYDEFLQTRKTIEDELHQTLQQRDKIHQRLLPGETPQLVAAHLQEIIKRLSEKNGIGIRSFRILEPKEMNVYKKVSIHIDFNPTNSMLGLSQFIHDIEQHEKGLMISEMDLLVINPRMPNNIQGSLVISGLMKSPKTKEKGKEGKSGEI